MSWHVYPLYYRRGWGVREIGKIRASVTYRTKKSAVKQAVKRAKRDKTWAITHSDAGRIEVLYQPRKR